MLDLILQFDPRGGYTICIAKDIVTKHDPHIRYINFVLQFGTCMHFWHLPTYILTFRPCTAIIAHVTKVGMYAWGRRSGRHVFGINTSTSPGIRTQAEKEGFKLFIILLY